MASINSWSESEILKIFKAMGIDEPANSPPNSPNPQIEPPCAPVVIFLPRLSDSSIPPPLGTIANAELENTRR